MGDFESSTTILRIGTLLRSRKHESDVDPNPNERRGLGMGRTGFLLIFVTTLEAVRADILTLIHLALPCQNTLHRSPATVYHLVRIPLRIPTTHSRLTL